ncbi:MAG: MBL fold metallo-hydrolase [Ancalomicrobiaceae bacterium]|nr:MBL fold metallo-hydrolase [Ancalomicrobiaceae bacterium]
MRPIDRRMMLGAGSAAVIAAAAGGFTSTAAQARAPVVGKQAVGFYRLKIGDFEITVISDGSLAFEPSLWNAPQKDVVDTLAAEGRDTRSVPFQLNTLVVNTGERLVLIDTGAGGKFQQSSGTLVTNLMAAGYRPEQIDTVIFTHLHPDHLWGATSANGSALVFPNADYVCSEAEVAFWSDAALPGHVPAAMRQMVEATQLALKAIASRLKRIKSGAEIFSGIASVDTPGHTPGHISVAITSGSDALMVSGDVVANATLSFRHPGWGIGFDMDQGQAAKTRSAFLDRCASDRTLIASYHLPFPALGRVLRNGTVYRWAPAEWRWTV